MQMRLQSRCSASDMFVKTRPESFQAVMRNKIAKLLSRLRQSPNTILNAIAGRCVFLVLTHYWYLICRK